MTRRIEWRSVYRTDDTLEMLQVALDLMAPAPAPRMNRTERRRLLRKLK